jgi:hypothetical protein
VHRHRSITQVDALSLLAGWSGRQILWVSVQL